MVCILVKHGINFSKAECISFDFKQNTLDNGLIVENATVIIEISAQAM